MRSRACQSAVARSTRGTWLRARVAFGLPSLHVGWVYWSYYGTIYRRPIVGGTLTTVFTPATHGSNYKDVAIHDSYIYSLHDEGLWKTSLDGTSRVLMAGHAGYDRLVIDEANLYLTAAAGQSIVKIPKSYVQP